MAPCSACLTGEAGGRVCPAGPTTSTSVKGSLSVSRTSCTTTSTSVKGSLSVSRTSCTTTSTSVKGSLSVSRTSCTTTSTSVKGSLSVSRTSCTTTSTSVKGSLSVSRTSFQFSFFPLTHRNRNKQCHGVVHLYMFERFILNMPSFR